MLTPLVWLLSSLFSALHLPRHQHAGNGIRLRSALLPLIRIVPKAMALAQLLAQGPIYTVIRVHTQRYKPASLLHVLTTSIGGLVNLPLFLALSLMELLLSLTIRYLLSMHGHATWTVTHVATNIFTCLGIPLLLAACKLGWERRSHEQRRRVLHGDKSCGVGRLGTAGQGEAGLGTAAAKVEDHVVSFPSSCSAAGASGEADGTGHMKQQQQQDQEQQQNEQRGQPAGGKAPVGNSSGGGGRFISSSAAESEGIEAVAAPSLSLMTRADGSMDSTGISPARSGGGSHHSAVLSGPPLLAAAAAAVAANNRARGYGGGAAPFDDPEKWASVILIRQILSQPIAEYQPMLTRQRVSIKVGPYSLSSKY